MLIDWGCHCLMALDLEGVEKREIGLQLVDWERILQM
jgi:hypothetical protein